MCLGIPMQVKTIEGFSARCEARGIERDVSLFLLPEGSVTVGDFVVVHVGYAIQTISEQESRSAWEIYDAMLDAQDALEQPPAVTAGAGKN